VKLSKILCFLNMHDWEPYEHVSAGTIIDNTKRMFEINHSLLSVKYGVDLDDIIWELEHYYNSGLGKILKRRRTEKLPFNVCLRCGVRSDKEIQKYYTKLMRIGNVELRKHVNKAKRKLQAKELTKDGTTV